MGLTVPLVDDPPDPVPVHQQICDLCFHDQRIARLPLTGLGQDVQKVPLRHESYVLMRSWDLGQIRNVVGARVQLDAYPLNPARWQRGKLRAQTEFVQQGEGGGMNGVAAEIAEEISMLL